MKAGTLFSGIGAPECAAPWIDWRWCAEIDPFACAVHAARFPGVPNLGDVTEADWHAVEPVDLVVGGPPCQGFSVAGQRGGLADPRGNLSLAYVGAVDAIDPEFSLTENVPGWLSMADNSFGHFLGRMVGADAALVPGRGQRWTDSGVAAGPRRTCAWRILDAQFHGVPQRRRRVFVVAVRGAGNWACAEALFPQQQGVRRNSAPRREKGEGVAPILEAGARTGKSTDDLRAGIGIGEAGDPMFTLQAGKHHAVAPTLPSRSTAGGRLGTDFDCDGGLIAKSIPARTWASHREDSDTLIPAVAWALQERDYKGSDSNTKPGHLIVSPLMAKTHRGRAQNLSTGFTSDEHIVADFLHADGFDASEDGTGRGVPLVTAFDTTQITSALNRSQPKAGDPCHPLASGSHPPAIAFDPGTITRPGSPNPSEMIAPTLDHGWHPLAIAFDPTARQPEWSINRPLKTDGPFAVAFTASEQANGYAWESTVAPALEAHPQSETSNRQSGIREGMSVRRLLPVECERLQGFPDHWTAITWRGKPAADGPRYRALGNSMAVPVVRWILERLAHVEDGP